MKYIMVIALLCLVGCADAGLADYPLIVGQPNYNVAASIAAAQRRDETLWLTQ